ncbi:hypothetical protein ACLUS7_01570 [Enterobacterales bacterium BD_CKDN230030183-1A_HGKHYDSX7]
MRLFPLIALLGSLTLLGGCFDRDNDDHATQGSDQSKSSVRMQNTDKPAPQPAPDPEPMPREENR